MNKLLPRSELRYGARYETKKKKTKSQTNKQTLEPKNWGDHVRITAQNQDDKFHPVQCPIAEASPRYVNQRLCLTTALCVYVDQSEWAQHQFPDPGHPGWGPEPIPRLGSSRMRPKTNSQAWVIHRIRVNMGGPEMGRSPETLKIIVLLAPPLTLPHKKCDVSIQKLKAWRQANKTCWTCVWPLSYLITYNIK